MLGKTILFMAAIYALTPFSAGAQSATDIAALRGLASVTVLKNSTEGKAALAANYTVTGGIQTGAIRQSTLLPSPSSNNRHCAMPASQAVISNSLLMDLGLRWALPT
jgi:hypothetical protein